MKNYLLKIPLILFETIFLFCGVYFPLARIDEFWFFSSEFSILSLTRDLYINGEIQTLTATTAYPQNEDTFVNKEAQKIEIASASHDAALKGLVSDVHLIDGQQLSPAAFGAFDSNTGVWNPKALSLPAPNDGTTWSSSSSDNGVRSGGTWAQLFDGDTSTFVTIDKSTSYGVALDNKKITCRQ